MLCAEAVEWMRSGESVWCVGVCIMLSFIADEHGRYGLPCMQVAVK